MTLADLLTLPAVQRSALGLGIGAVALPVVGVFIVGLDIVAVRFAIMHVALLGIAVGLLTGVDPVVAGLLACALSGAAMAPVARRPAGLPGAMGLLMTFAIAGALLVLSISGVNANGAFELLWGSMLATRTIDLVVLAALALVVHLLYWRHRRALALLLFDRELALCSGVPAGRLMLILLVVVAVAIGASIRLTGALLVDALTILPAIGARNLGNSLRSMVGWAITLGVVGNAAGFFLALVLDQPLGPVLVLTAGTLTLLTYLIPEGALHATNSTSTDRTTPDGNEPYRAGGGRPSRSSRGGCAGADRAGAPPAAGPTVVASTSWVAALAKAAGAAEVTVVAPASVQHPPDYDPRPSDLAAVADADFVLFAEFDGFASRLREAAGGTSKLVQVQLENRPQSVRAEVTRIGELLGTSAAAAQWLTGFGAEYERLSAEVKKAVPTAATAAVAHVFMSYWATEFAGLQLVGTYGPEPITPGKLAELTAAQPRLELANSHLPGMNPDLTGATRVEIVNYPGEDLDLLQVYRTNAERLKSALSRL